jgi:hypothetical protein
VKPASKDAKVEALKVMPEPAAAAPADAGAADATKNAAAAGDGGAASASKTPPLAPFEASTDAERPQVSTSSAFNQGGDPIADLSPDGNRDVVTFAFGAKDGDVLGDPVRTKDSDFVVVQLKEHKTSTHDDFDKERDTFLAQILSSKQAEALSLYVKRLREAAKNDIKIDEQYVKEASADGGASSQDEEDEY